MPLESASVAKKTRDLLDGNTMNDLYNLMPKKLHDALMNEARAIVKRYPHLTIWNARGHLAEFVLFFERPDTYPILRVGNLYYCVPELFLNEKGWTAKFFELGK